ncbi:MAG: arylsulfatase [Bacteroidota bacterium]|nr:arylsulfatase [Bacteroidota bacterium]MDE2644382.1 arylsulfatase [Bacteroidota bacterium]
MSRLTHVVFSVMLLASCSIERPPNVITILTDDQGWGDLSINGNTSINTPNIDRIARSGARFENYYVSPVCSPTRAELLTGRYHPRSGVHGTSAGSERIDLDETLLSDVFHDVGYATGVFGKWHNGQQAPYHPNSRGFDHFYGFPSGHWGHYFSPPLERNGELVQGSGYLSDDLTESAMEFMRAHTESPFLVFLSYNTPHSPMQVPDEWWNQVLELRQDPRSPEQEDTLHTRAALAMMLNIDWNVGRVLTLLDNLSLTEETIVLYFSDNGPNGLRWNADMKGRKGSTDEGGVRSPLLMQWPGMIAEGTVITDITAAIDLMPTLAEFSNIDLNTNYPLDGVSFAPLLRGEIESMPERLIFSHWRGRTSVRTQTYRLGHSGGLFDMVNDREQRVDLASEYPELADSLEEAKARWIREVVPEAYRKHPFTIGSEDERITWLPARDATASEGIKRSNRYPNDSFLTNWTSTQDSILWEADVLTTGEYKATLYYTTAVGNEGAQIDLSFGDASLQATIVEAHNPAEYGMKEDRVQRIESYVKDFRPLVLGSISLEAGQESLVLQAISIPGKAVADVRLLQLERVVEL